MAQEAFHSIEVAKGLNKALLEAKKLGAFRGIKVETNFFLSHLLFVDDILLFCDGLHKDAKNLREVLDLYCLANGMQINVGKSFMGVGKENKVLFMQFFLFLKLNVTRALNIRGSPSHLLVHN